MSNRALYERLFRQALLIREVEQRIVDLYPTDRIQSPVHLSIGQEAVAVGVCHGLTNEDLLFGTYRGHAFYLAKGGDLKRMMAELFGKVTGCGRGKAGSMHLAAPEVGFMGCSAVVASSIPHAVGAAWAAKVLGKGSIVVAVFGDGATDEGVYHECLNFTVLHELPLLLVCENNGLAVHSRTAARQAYCILAHARSYGLAVDRIEEGYDFVEVAERMEDHVQTIRAERRPRMVEIMTCRYKEHVGPGDDFQAGYRSAAELESWKRKDPLCYDLAMRNKYLDGVLEEIDEAVAFAQRSPWPGPEELLAHVYG